MIPWRKIDRSSIPGQEGEISLLQRGKEFSIRIAGVELMNSRLNGSERSLAVATCHRIKRKTGRRILIGGLGMSYTLAAALENSTADTHITVAELIPKVVQWNRDHLGHLTGDPLNDKRVSVALEDVGQIIRKDRSRWDAILLDVDNGPEGLTRRDNDKLYSVSGLRNAFSALRPGGIFAIWSSESSEVFNRHLVKCGFKTESLTVRARKSGKGGKRIIWLAERAWSPNA